MHIAIHPCAHGMSLYVRYRVGESAMQDKPSYPAEAMTLQYHPSCVQCLVNSYRAAISPSLYCMLGLVARLSVI